MQIFEIQDAQNIFEELIARVEAGEEILLSSGNVAVAILVPFTRE